MTTLAKLVAKQIDIGEYVTYVFEVVEEEERKRLSTKYIMCTRYPNWNHGTIDEGEVGYLDFEEVRAGIDKWFDGEKMVYYNYNNIQFNKFVPKSAKDKHEYIMQITLNINYYEKVYM